MKNKVDVNSLPINENIRAPKVQLITHEGQNLGLIDRNEALRMAYGANLDLVIIAPQGPDGFPVTKIMDYGKILYEKKKKQAEAKKHQKVIQVKEIKMSPKIGEHDYQIKMKQAVQFLEQGKHVKFTLIFRGREAALKNERGGEMYAKIDQNFKDNGLTTEYEKESRLGSLWTRIYFLKAK